MRFSRSVPAPWMVRGELDLLARQIAVGIVGELLAEDQDAVERRAQLVRHVGEEFGLVLRGQRQLRRLFLQRAAGLLDFLVLALHLDIALGELLRLQFQLLVGLLQLLLLRLQLAGELLRLLQQAFGLHRRFDAVEHDADAGGELLQEGQMRGVNSFSEASAMTALTWSSNMTGKTTRLRGRASRQRRIDARRQSRGNVGHEDAAPVDARIGRRSPRRAAAGADSRFA